MHSWIRLLWILVLALPLAGQDQLQVVIPFAFEMNDTTLDSGQYSVRLNPDRGLLMVIPIDGSRSAATTLFRAGLGTQDSMKGMIYFRRYGDRYFLAGADFPWVRVGAPKSRAEREFVSSRVITKKVPAERVVVAALVR